VRTPTGTEAARHWPITGECVEQASNDSPEPSELLKELRDVVRSGASATRLSQSKLPTLMGLAIVGVEAATNRPLDRAIALETVLREAAEALGDGPTGETVRLLLGLTSRSRGLLLKDRRDLAADHLGIRADTFRKGWEQELLIELADELYKLETERRVPVRVRGRRRAGPVLDEFRQGTGGKSLDRREAEARLWSLMYALRADLLAVAHWRDTQPEGEQWRPYAHSALWLYGRFIADMATFVDLYGSALVMAGNEVTVREAASLLGWRPPLDDEAAAYLRLQVMNTDDLAGSMQKLASEQRGQELLRLWDGWLGN